MTSPLLVSHSDGGGGADRAAHRILQAVALHEPDATMWVAEKVTRDPRVSTFADVIGSEPRWKSSLRSRSEDLPLYLQKSTNAVHRSFNLVSRGIASAIEHSDPSVVHLHWLGQGTLGIKEIGSLPGPVVWTLHDSWPFCGAEHHPEDLRDHRFENAYSPDSRRPGNTRVDVDAWTYRRKVRWFQQPRWLVGPSQWMVDQASKASLTHDWPSSVIPNPIDTEVFAPVDQDQARARWDMPRGARVALFGGVAAGAIHGKGWDLLESALAELPRGEVPWELWTFGGPSVVTSVHGIRVHSMGVIEDPKNLASLYSAADVHVVPSRMESFSQTAAESIACGTPVIAFRVGGLPEVVHDDRAGILVDPFDTHAFAEAMDKAVELKAQTMRIGPELARTWRPDTVGRQYLETYELAREYWERRIRRTPQTSLD